jgi:hypothetical protein
MAVVALVKRPENHRAGEEHGREDENDAGDDHHPRRGRI